MFAAEPPLTSTPAASGGEAEAFVKGHAGQLAWAEALRDSRIRLDGPSWLARAFPSWNARSTFAHIKPVPGAAIAN